LASSGHLRPERKAVKKSAEKRIEARLRLFPGGNPAKSARGTSDPGTGMLELLGFISFVLTLYIYVLIAAAVLSWLIAFNVVNTRNQIVHMVAEFLYRITEPALRPIRKLLPNLGGIDLSPVILILIIVFVQSVILPNLAKLLV
jgi:YggT family protein